MPPRPDVEFNFNLPHGIEAEDDEDQQERLENSMDLDHSMQNLNPLEDARQTTECSHNSDMQEQSLAHRDMDYQTLEKGFSDDDNAPEAFDRSWLAHQTRKSPPKKKKSPRADDGEDEAVPRSKKPRQSLFGGPTAEAEEHQYDDLFEEQPEDRLVDEANDLPAPEVTKQNIGNRMSSVNLEQQETDARPSEQPLNLGFGFGDSDREGMSPRASPAPSEGELVIPPDTQVSVLSL